MKRKEVRVEIKEVKMKRSERKRFDRTQGQRSGWSSERAIGQCHVSPPCSMMPAIPFNSIFKQNLIEANIGHHSTGECCFDVGTTVFGSLGKIPTFSAGRFCWLPLPYHYEFYCLFGIFSNSAHSITIFKLLQSFSGSLQFSWVSIFIQYTILEAKARSETGLSCFIPFFMWLRLSLESTAESAPESVHRSRSFTACHRPCCLSLVSQTAFPAMTTLVERWN